MTVASILARARYLALVLPIFALFSTIQGGCTIGNTGYGYGYSGLGSSGSSGSDCVTYGAYGYYGGYVSYTNCTGGR